MRKLSRGAQAEIDAKGGKKDGGNKMDSNSLSIFEGNQMNEFFRVEQTDGDGLDFLHFFSSTSLSLSF